MHGDIGLHAAPIVVGDTIIIGAAHTEGSRPVSRRNDKGYVRGYDVRTGKRLWIFHTIPRPGEYGYDTWQQGSEEYTGNTGVWAQMSADEELGLRVSAGRDADRRLLRRPPARARASSARASSRSTSRPASASGTSSSSSTASGTGTCRARRSWPTSSIDGKPAQDRRAADQAGLALRVRPRDRRADLAVRGAEGRSLGRAGRDGATRRSSSSPSRRPTSARACRPTT